MAEELRKRRRVDNDGLRLQDQQCRGQRIDLQSQLKAQFESIFDKYGKDFTGVGDEIDLRTGRLVIDNGHIIGMRHEHDVATRNNSKRPSYHLSNNRRISSRGAPTGFTGIVMNQSNQEASDTTREARKVRTGAANSALATGIINACKPDSLSAPSPVLARAPARPNDPRWDAPEVPGLAPLYSELPFAAETLPPLIARSPSPEISVWDWQQQETPRTYTKKHHQTPWNHSNDQLLTYLRTTRRLPFSELEAFFPGRKAATIRAHWLTLQQRSRNNGTAIVSHRDDPTTERGNEVEAPVRIIRTASQRESLQSHYSQPRTDRQGANSPGLHSMPSSSISIASVRKSQRIFESRSQIDDDIRSSGPHIFTCDWVENTPNCVWTSDQDSKLKELIGTFKYDRIKGKERKGAVEAILLHLQPFIYRQTWDPSTHDPKFRTQISRRLTQLSKEVFTDPATGSLHLSCVARSSCEPSYNDTKGRSSSAQRQSPHRCLRSSIPERGHLQGKISIATNKPRETSKILRQRESHESPQAFATKQGALQHTDLLNEYQSTSEGGEDLSSTAITALPEEGQRPVPRYKPNIASHQSRSSGIDHSARLRVKQAHEDAQDRASLPLEAWELDTITAPTDHELLEQGDTGQVDDLEIADLTQQLHVIGETHGVLSTPRLPIESQPELLGPGQGLHTKTTEAPGLSQEHPIDLTTETIPQPSPSAFKQRSRKRSGDATWTPLRQVKVTTLRSYEKTPARFAKKIPKTSWHESSKQARPESSGPTNVELSSSRVSFMSMLPDDSEDELAKPYLVSSHSRVRRHSRSAERRAPLVASCCGSSSTACKRKFCVRCCEDDELASLV